MLASNAFAGVMDTRASDRMYDCLPLYHTAGGVVATGALLVRGGSVVIRDKFSAREFWDDIVRWDCTLFQYIGELCRYLVNSPPHPNERAHQLRLACGNGLRPDVWPEFKRAFPHSADHRVLRRDRRQRLAVQFRRQARRGRPRCRGGSRGRFPTKIVRFDVERQQPVRDEHGFCIECDAGRGRRGDRQDPEGSVEAGPALRGLRRRKAETDKKILRDVFEKGDIWFRTGDLMRKDANGYFYFVDRIGDTFRWKGENVSTTEVEEAIGDFAGMLEANVYGVAGARAATAAPAWPRWSPSDNLDLAALARASGAAPAGLCAAGVPAHPRATSTSPRPSSRRRSTW